MPSQGLSASVPNQNFASVLAGSNTLNISGLLEILGYKDLRANIYYADSEQRNEERPLIEALLNYNAASTSLDDLQRLKNLLVDARKNAQRDYKNAIKKQKLHQKEAKIETTNAAASYPSWASLLFKKLVGTSRAQQEKDSARNAELIQTKIQTIDAFIEQLDKELVLPTLPDFALKDFDLAIKESRELVAASSEFNEEQNNEQTNVSSDAIPSQHLAHSRRYLEVPIGSESLVNTNTLNNQTASAIAVLPNGDYVVAWTLQKDTTTYKEGIQAQRFFANGTKSGIEFPVNTNDINSQINPSVAAFSNGDFIITWQTLSTDWDIAAQRFNATGAKLGTEFVVNTNLPGVQILPRIASSANDSFIITWTTNPTGAGYGVNAQFFNASGAKYSPEFRVNTYLPDDQYGAAIAADKITGNFLICWGSNNQDGSGWGVYGQSFNSTASPLGSEFRVNTYINGDQQYPQIAVQKNVTFIVSWNSFGQDGDANGVFGQRVAVGGALIGSEFQINTYSAGDQVGGSSSSSGTTVAVDPNTDGFAVVWSSYLQDGSGWGVYGQRFNATAGKIGNSFPVNSYTQGDQSTPSIAMQPSNSFIVGWQGQGTNNKTGIYSQLFQWNATPKLDINIISIRYNQTVLFDSTMLRASDADRDTVNVGLTYIASNVTGGQFEFPSAPGVAINQFTFVQVNQSTQVAFVQNGSNEPPSYMISVTDGETTTLPQAANVTFFRQPFGLNATFTVLEGGKRVLGLGDIYAVDDYPDSQVLFYPSALQHIQYNLNNTAVLNITQFSRQQLIAGQVSVQHDGSELGASGDIALKDDYFTIAPVPASITIIPVNDPPVISKNSLEILQAQTLNVTANEIWTLDPDTPDDLLTYYISNLQHAVFRSIPQNSIMNTFSQLNISQGDIQIVHDGSTFPPYYLVTVTDGEFYVGPQAPAPLTFNGINSPPILGNNVLYISEGQSVVLTTSQLSASDSDTPSSQVIFIPTDVQHGQFERSVFPGVAITSFSLEAVQLYAIRFVHDGSEFAPSYNMAVTDGSTTTASRAAVVNYTPVNNSPVLVNNTWKLVEGDRLTVTSLQLSATDRDNAAGTLLFIITSLVHCNFQFANSTLTVSSFLQQAVFDEQIEFVHDGSNEPPSFLVEVTDGQIRTTPSAPVIDFTSVNDPPELKLNSLTITQGTSVTVMPENLAATDEETPSADLLFTASNITGGHFEYATAPNIPITTFSQDKIQKTEIRFVQKGAEPGYAISVSDGQLATPAERAVITYNPQNIKNQNNTNYESAFILAGISGAFGFLFLFARLWVARKVNERFQKLLEDKDRDESETRSIDFRKKVLRPIVEKILGGAIKTTGCLGSRSQWETESYYNAIVRLVDKLELGGMDVEHIMTAKDKAGKERLLNDIVRQIRIFLIPNRNCCSRLTLFKPEITPEDLVKFGAAIAQAVCKQSLEYSRQSLAEGVEMSVEMSELNSPKGLQDQKHQGNSRLIAPLQRSSSVDRIDVLEKKIQSLETTVSFLPQRIYNQVVGYFYPGSQTQQAASSNYLNEEEAVSINSPSMSPGEA